MDEILRRSGLDKAFCFVFDNSTIESITPYRLAIYSFIHTADEQHRLKSFSHRQLHDLSLLIYQLLRTADQDFPTLCRIIKSSVLDISTKLYENFLRRICEHLGDEEVLISKEQLLHHSRRSERIDRGQSFAFPKSIIGILVRKLAVTRLRQSVTEIELNHEQWKEWISQAHSCDEGFSNENDDVNRKITDTTEPVPLMSDFSVSGSLAKFSMPCLGMQPVSASSFINSLSSDGARSFINHQLHALHVSPSDALEIDQLKVFCEAIKKRFRDLPHVHLVEMMNSIRSHCVMEAENSLRQYFDWIAIRLNETNSAERSITAIDKRPLRYAPLLHARLARQFGQKVQARNLISEAVHQAQTNRDLVCLRLALFEQAAIDACEDLVDDADSIAQTNIFDNSIEILENDNDCDTNNTLVSDTRSFIQQLQDCAMLQHCVSLAKSGDDPSRLAKCLQLCVGADYGADRESQSRMISESARVITASVKLANGFFESAAADCCTLLHFSTGDQWCKRFDTDSHVIAAVNFIYCQAYNGHFDKAINLINQVKERFTDKIIWQSTHIWKSCESLIGFDRAFFIGKWTFANRCLAVMDRLVPYESGMRRAILKYTMGYKLEAIDEARKCSEKAKSSKDIRIRLRCQITLAMLYASSNLENVAISILERCKSTAKACGFEVLQAMISRRIAYIHASSNLFEMSLTELEDCEWIIRNRCSPLEISLLHLTYNVAYDQNKNSEKYNDPIASRYTSLTLALREAHRASTPLLEKSIFMELGFLFDKCGRFDERDDCATIINQISDKYPGYIDWTVL